MGVKVRKMSLGRFDDAGNKVKKGDPGFDKATTRYSEEYWIFVNHKRDRPAIKGVKDYKKTEALAEKTRIAYATGRVVPSSKPKALFRDCYDTWIKDHVGLTCQKSTAHVYAVIWKNHVKDHLGHLGIDAIDRAKIREFYRVKTEAGYSKNTLKNMRNLISGVMSLAIEDKIIGTNPAARSGKYLKGAKKERKPEFLSPDEYGLVLDKARGIFYPFFLTAVRTGLRQGELIGLKWGDIDWVGKFLTVKRTIYKGQDKPPKNGKERPVDMSDQLLEVLKDYQNEVKQSMPLGELPEYVFLSRCNKPYEPSWIRKVFANYLTAAGLRQVPFHALRHSYASALIAEKAMTDECGNIVIENGKPVMLPGASLKYVQEQMGHGSIRITADTYGHLIRGANREQANQLDDAGRPKSASQAQVKDIRHGNS